MNTVTDVIREDLDGLMHLMKEAYTAAGFCWPDTFVPEQRIRRMLEAFETQDLSHKSVRHELAELKGNNVAFNRLLALNPIVMIWSQEHGLYWREGRSGYTSEMVRAGAYRFKDAWDATNHCGKDKGIAYVELPSP